MALKGTDILKRAEYLVDDEIDPTDALPIINLGLDDLSLEAPRADKATVVITAGSSSIALPSNCLSINQVWKGTRELGEEYSPFSHDETVTGVPSKFALVGNLLTVYPTPTVDTTLKLLVLKSYTPLNTLDDVPVDLPEQFHIALIFWLLSNFKYFDDETQDASYFLKEYWRYRIALKDYQENRSGYHSM